MILGCGSITSKAIYPDRNLISDKVKSNINLSNNDQSLGTIYAVKNIAKSEENKCIGNIKDCAGECGGSAYLDNCGNCIEVGKEGNYECSMDSNDVWGEEDSTEFLIPKEIYPIINQTFNPFPVYGFTGEFKFHYKNKVDFSFLGSIYMQDTQVITPGSYYTIESKVSIRDNVLKNVSFIDFYLSNMFFWTIDDQDKLSFGCSMGFELPFGMSLKFDLGKVYYDSNLDGNKNSVLNSGMELGVSF